MSDPPAILPYEDIREPEVRLGRAALGAGILTLETLLLLLFRFAIGPMMLDPPRGTGGGGGGAGFTMSLISIAIYSLLSICVPAATWLLAGAKLPRIHAGRVLG